MNGFKGTTPTDGKRKVRPGRRGVDAYGQPVHVVPGAVGGAEEAEQFEDGQVGEMGAETDAAQFKRPVGCGLNLNLYNFLDNLQ